MTLPSLTSAFCATMSTPRMFLTVFADLLTASLMASSNPLLDVPTSSIIFPTGILSLLFSLRLTISRFQMKHGVDGSNECKDPLEKKDPTACDRKRYD